MCPSSNFMDIPTYVPGLVSSKPGWHMHLQLGCTYYPFLATEMGPWLRATKQGMLPQQVPLVQQMICLGWLLFTAAEYNLSEFARKYNTKLGQRWQYHSAQSTMVLWSMQHAPL